MIKLFLALLEPYSQRNYNAIILKVGRMLVCPSHLDPPLPFQSYLIAIAAGKLESRKIGPRSHVWSEAEFVDAAAAEFEDTEVGNDFVPYALLDTLLFFPSLIGSL